MAGASIDGVARQGEEDADVLERLVAGRFSCRGYQNRQVPDATIERILKISQRTPSWCNSQPWQVIVTRGEGTEKLRKVLYEAAKSQVPAAPDFPFPREYVGVYQERRRESGFQLYNALSIPRGDKEAYARQTLENFRFFGAPHVAIVTTEEALGVYGAVDCGAYVCSFALAAQALGVATIPQAALARLSPQIREHFSLPPSRRIVCGISFGFADAAHPANSFRTNRAELPAVLRWAD